MSTQITRSRLVLTGAAVLALAVVTGCSSAKEPTAAVPTTSSPTLAGTPSESASPSATTAPPTVATGSVAITKAGTTLAFGGVANVEIGLSKTPWIGGLKVTALEKAPISDFTDLGVRDDAGSVYYVRYDVTYLSGKTTNPPTGGDLSGQRVHPLTAPGQRLSLISKSVKKCDTRHYEADGTPSRIGGDFLVIGQSATNMCMAFVVDKGTVTQVVHTVYDTVKRENQTITWK